MAVDTRVLTKNGIHIQVLENKNMRGKAVCSGLVYGSAVTFEYSATPCGKTTGTSIQAGGWEVANWEWEHQKWRNPHASKQTRPRT